MSIELTIIIITILILMFDLWLYNDGVEGNTISQVVIKYSYKYPMIPFVLGVLLGHWYA